MDIFNEFAKSLYSSREITKLKKICLQAHANLVRALKHTDNKERKKIQRPIYDSHTKTPTQPEAHGVP
jgi:hypothetical protein